MSGGSPAGTAVTGAALTFGGLAFARAGWAGLRGPAASASAAVPPAAPAPRQSLGWKALYAAILLFGVFVTACGILLFLAVFLGD
ncbi:MAG TPA: hypothetical protein VGB08_04415 [Allosphingosinicella sp.]|jgi:hypothetical protein